MAQYTATGPFSGQGGLGVDRPLGDAEVVPLIIADAGTIVDIDVNIDYGCSSCFGDVVLELAHVETSTSIFLIQPDNDFFGCFSICQDDLTFDDEAGITYFDGQSNGFVRPDGGSLSAFDGEAITGTWELRISDDSCCPFEGDVLNSWSINATLLTAIQVEIDIKPGSPENTVNLGSKGVTNVAILSSETFDATQVDPLTVELADAEVRVKGNGKPQVTVQDVNGDGFLDLVLHMETEGFSLTNGDVSADLVGSTFSAENIEGSDLVRVVP